MKKTRTVLNQDHKNASRRPFGRRLALILYDAFGYFTFTGKTPRATYGFWEWIMLEWPCNEKKETMGFSRRSFLLSGAALTFAGGAASPPGNGVFAEPQRNLPLAEDCDVIVAGGGPAGIAAATSAARACMAKDADNLYLAGRCISGDFIPMASYRVTGSAVAMGEAVGRVAASCAKTKRDIACDGQTA